MGIETMRRWPFYIVFAVCFLLTLALFNNWNLETELRNRISDLSQQLRDCSKLQKSCMEDSLTLLEEKQGYASKYSAVDKQKSELESKLEVNKAKLSKTETQWNRTQVDVEICRTELQSLKNLHLSKSAMLETLRLEKDTLTEDLEKKKSKIEDMDKEIERIKAELKSKPDQSNINAQQSVVAPKLSSKVTPMAPPLKLSPMAVLNKPIEPEIEDNNAKEELEDKDINVINEGNNPDMNDPNDADFDQQV